MQPVILKKKIKSIFFIHFFDRIGCNITSLPQAKVLAEFENYEECYFIQNENGTSNCAVLAKKRHVMVRSVASVRKTTSSNMSMDPRCFFSASIIAKLPRVPPNYSKVADTDRKSGNKYR